ncbi:hypothetical protein OG21DRAFT_1528007, partial [Imleria badia]
RKPDITCYFPTPDSTSNCTWEKVVTFCEVKTRADPKRDKESFVEIAGKVLCLFGAQDGRYFVSCIRILGSSIYLTTFHRSGSVSIHPSDINSSPLQFLHILISISFSDYVNIGFDTSIKWDSLNPDSKSDCSDSEYGDPESDHHDLEHSNPEHDNDYSEYSDSELEEPQLVVVPQLEAPGSDVSLEEDDEWKRTKWIEIVDKHGQHRKIWLKSVLAISDSLLGQGTTVWEGEIDSSSMNERVMIKDLWTNPLRKYTEGMILHILEQHGIEALPPNSLFQLCALSRLVSQPVGKLILEFSSIGELLVAFLNYTVTHKNAVEVAGVLHRDVSPSNLFFGKARNRTDHSVHMEHLLDKDRERLCEETRNLKQRGILGDWGYTVPFATPVATTSSDSSSDVDIPRSDEIPTSPIEADASEPSVQYDNLVLAQKIDSQDPPALVPISELTAEDDIVLFMGTDNPKNDPCKTIDLCPLYRTGTWLWMSVQLVMAGPGQPVIHDAVHDLESIFYVLVGICVLYNGPSKQRSEQELAKCYDKFSNTYEPSILKTITIQSDLTWIPHIVQHIHPFFEPVIPLLELLRVEIILPLATDKEGNFYRKTSCSHDTFIKHIVTTLSKLGPEHWDGTLLKSKPDTSHWTSSEVTATQCRSGLSTVVLLSAPPTVPKELPQGRGIIRSDPGLQQQRLGRN